MIRPRKIDGNQNEIVKQLRSIPGVSVRITSMLGDGFGDLVLGFRNQNFLIELKDPSKPPSKRRLTDEEIKFRDAWQGNYSVCETLEDILKVIKLKSDASNNV